MSGDGIVPTTSAPAAAAIAQDTPCRKCGYNLRGLSVEGRCPECGTSVGFSLQGDLLRYCDPNWVDALRRGVKCIIAAVVLGIFGVVAGIALGVGAGNAGIGFAVGGGAVVVAMIVAAVGWWMLTQPDPSGLGEDQYGTPRKIIRVAQVVGLAHVALVGLTATITVDDATLLALQAVSVVAIVVSAVGIFAECSYLERIARRIPDEKLSSRAHFLMWALGVSYAGSQLMSTAANLSGSRRPTQGFVCFNAILNLFMLVFLIMFLLMLEKIGKRFKEQATAARQTWAAVPFQALTPPATGTPLV